MSKFWTSKVNIRRDLFTFILKQVASIYIFQHVRFQSKRQIDDMFWSISFYIFSFKSCKLILSKFWISKVKLVRILTFILKQVEFIYILQHVCFQSKRWIDEMFWSISSIYFHLGVPWFNCQSFRHQRLK